MVLKGFMRLLALLLIRHKFRSKTSLINGCVMCPNESHDSNFPVFLVIVLKEKTCLALVFSVRLFKMSINNALKMKLG